MSSIAEDGNDSGTISKVSVQSPSEAMCTVEKFRVGGNTDEDADTCQPLLVKPGSFTLSSSCVFANYFKFAPAGLRRRSHIKMSESLLPRSLNSPNQSTEIVNQLLSEGYGESLYCSSDSNPHDLSTSQMEHPPEGRQAGYNTSTLFSDGISGSNTHDWSYASPKVPERSSNESTNSTLQSSVSTDDYLLPSKPRLHMPNSPYMRQHDYHDGRNARKRSIHTRKSNGENAARIRELEAQLKMLAKQNVSYRRELTNMRQQWREATDNYEALLSQCQAVGPRLRQLKLLVADLQSDHDYLRGTGETIGKEVACIRQHIDAQAVTIKDLSEDCQTIATRSEHCLKNICVLRDMSCSEACQNNSTLEALQAIEQEISSTLADAKANAEGSNTSESFKAKITSELQSVRGEICNCHETQMAVLMNMDGCIEYIKSRIDQDQNSVMQSQNCSESLVNIESAPESLTYDAAASDLSAGTGLLQVPPESQGLKDHNEKLRTVNGDFHNEKNSSSEEVCELHAQLKALKRDTKSRKAKAAEKIYAQRELEAERAVLEREHSNELAQIRSEFEIEVQAYDRELSESRADVKKCQQLAEKLNVELKQGAEENRRLENQLHNQEKRLPRQNDEPQKLTPEHRSSQNPSELDFKPPQSHEPNPRPEDLRSLEAPETQLIDDRGKSAAKTVNDATAQNSVKPSLPQNDVGTPNYDTFDDDAFIGLSQDIQLSPEPACLKLTNASPTSGATCQNTPGEHNNTNLSQQVIRGGDNVVAVSSPPNDSIDKLGTLRSQKGPSTLSSLVRDADSIKNDDRCRAVTVMDTSPKTSSPVKRVTFIPHSRPMTANYEMLLRSSDIVDFGRYASIANNKSLGLQTAGKLEKPVAFGTLPSKCHEQDILARGRKRQAPNANDKRKPDFKRSKTCSSDPFTSRVSAGVLGIENVPPGQMTKGGRRRTVQGSKKHETHFGGDAGKS